MPLYDDLDAGTTATLDQEADDLTSTSYGAPEGVSSYQEELGKLHSNVANEYQLMESVKEMILKGQDFDEVDAFIEKSWPGDLMRDQRVSKMGEALETIAAGTNRNDAFAISSRLRAMANFEQQIQERRGMTLQGHRFESYNATRDNLQNILEGLLDPRGITPPIYSISSSEAQKRISQIVVSDTDISRDKLRQIEKLVEKGGPYELDRMQTGDAVLTGLVKLFDDKRNAGEFFSHQGREEFIDYMQNLCLEFRLGQMGSKYVDFERGVMDDLRNPDSIYFQKVTFNTKTSLADDVKTHTTPAPDPQGKVNVTQGPAAPATPTKQVPDQSTTQPPSADELEALTKNSEIIQSGVKVLGKAFLQGLVKTLSSKKDVAKPQTSPDPDPQVQLNAAPDPVATVVPTKQVSVQPTTQTPSADELEALRKNGAILQNGAKVLGKALLQGLATTLRSKNDADRDASTTQTDSDKAKVTTGQVTRFDNSLIDRVVHSGDFERFPALELSYARADFSYLSKLTEDLIRRSTNALTDAEKIKLGKIGAYFYRIDSSSFGAKARMVETYNELMNHWLPSGADPENDQIKIMIHEQVATGFPVHDMLPPNPDSDPIPAHETAIDQFQAVLLGEKQWSTDMEAALVEAVRNGQSDQVVAAVATYAKYLARLNNDQSDKAEVKRAKHNLRKVVDLLNKTGLTQKVAEKVLK